MRSSANRTDPLLAQAPSHPPLGEGVRSRGGALMTVLGVLLAASGCPEASRRPLGSTCGADSECASGLCGGGVCMDPALDDDQDGLTNGFEVSIGSDPRNPDSDGDGILDGEEIGSGLALIDTDGDGSPDILESATNDADGDCIPDQFDADNDIPNSDLSPIIDLVCAFQGVCAGQRAAMGAECIEIDGAKVGRCLYGGVPGYSNPEASCDGIDQNCDGVADDGFPDRDGDGIADCMDEDWDNDGVVDASDNCPKLFNAGQEDADGDGVGDACVSQYGLAFVTTPSGVLATRPFGAGVGIVEREADGAPLPAFRGAVTVGLAANASGAVLSGTLTRSAGGDGVAAFDDLVVDRAAAVRLEASSGGLAGAGVDVTVAAIAFHVEGLPATATAGEAVGFQLVVRDLAGGVVTDFEGAVTLEVSDDAATVPAARAFVAGDGGRISVEGLVFRTAGAQTVRAVGAIGASEPANVAVGAAVASRLVLDGPGEVEAGEVVSLGVTAYDAFDNVATGYRGTVTFASSDARARLPAAVTFSAGDAGVRTFDGVVLETAGAQTVTVSDAMAELSAELAVAVRHAAAARLDVMAPATIGSGLAFDVAVTVRDAFANAVTGYVGTLALTSSDAAARLPGAYAMTAADLGSHGFEGLRLFTAGAQTVTVSDGALSQTVGVEVLPGDASSLVIVEHPATVVAGAPFTVTVELRDAVGNLAPDRARTLRVTTSGGAAPIDRPVATARATLGPFTLTSAGAATLTVAEVGSGLSDTAGLEVEPAAAARLGLAVPAGPLSEGQSFSVTVTAYDTWDNVATGYRGTVGFTSGDAAATLPAAVTFTSANAGVRTVAGFALRTFGVQTVTAGDGTLTRAESVQVLCGAPHAITLDGLATTTVAGVAVPGFGFRVTDPSGDECVPSELAVVVTTGDVLATIPGPYPVSGASTTGTVSGLILRTAGNQQVTVTAGALTASGTVAVQPAGAATLEVALADDVLPAGVGTSVTVTARDVFGNRAAGYLGTVRFTAPGDANATVPGNVSFDASDAGRRTVGGVVFRTAGAQTLVATDTVNAAITGSDTIVIEQGNDVVFVLSGAPANVTAGDTFGVTLTVEDLFGNRIEDYTGTVRFAARTAENQPAPGATLPADYAFVVGDAGQRVFTGLALTSAQLTTLRVNDLATPAVQASAVVDVRPASMNTLTMSCTPTTLTAGEPTSCTVRALDAFLNTATGYRGTVGFVANETSPAPTLPANYTFTAGDQGQHTFSGLVLRKAGAQTVTVSDGPVNAAVSFTVDPASANRLGLTSGGSTSTTGTAAQNVPMRLVAYDPFDNVATGYRGTVSFAATQIPGRPDSPNLPAATTFGAGDAGMRDFATGATFFSAGTRTVTATDTVNPGLTTTLTVEVDHATPSVLTLTSTSSTFTAGSAFPVTVTVSDAYGNRATGYRGTVSFTHNDPRANAPLPAVPSNYTFLASDNGQRTFANAVTLYTAGARSVSATDTGNASINGTLNLTLGHAAASSFVVTSTSSTFTAGTAFPVTVRVNDAFGNLATGYTGTVAFSHDDPRANAPLPAVPSNYTFTASDNGQRVFANAVTLYTAGARSVTASDTVNGTLAGTLNLALSPRPIADALRWVSQPTDGLAGVPLPPIRVELIDAYGNRLNSSGATVSLTIDTNPGLAVLTGGSATTSSGLATFDTARLDRPGLGFRIRASHGALTATSSEFDIAWMPPVLNPSPTGIVQDGTCVDIAYEIAHNLAQPVELHFEYRRSYDTRWTTATQAGAPRPMVALDPHGSTGVRSQTGPVTRSFRWNALRDLGPIRRSVELRATARVGEAETTSLLGTVEFDASWTARLETADSTAILTHATIVDLDRDGTPDLIGVAQAPTQPGFYFFKGKVGGGLAEAQFVALDNYQGLSARRVAVANLDATAIPWVIIADAAMDRLALVPIDIRIPAGFVVGHQYEIRNVCGGPGPWVVDIDTRNMMADHFPEVIVTCAGSKTVRLAGYDGQRFIVRRTLDVPSRPFATVVGDPDWDGRQDIIVGMDHGTIAVYTPDSGLPLQVLSLDVSHDISVTDLELADLDGDGQRDLIASTGRADTLPVAGDPRIHIVRGAVVRHGDPPAPTTTKMFSAEAPVAISLAHAVGEIAVADLDRDGRPDVISAHPEDDRIGFIRILTTLSPNPEAVSYHVVGDTDRGPVGLEARDLNHDGWTDLAFVRATLTDLKRGGALLTEARRDCDLTFRGPGAAPSYRDVVARTVLHDMDGDGRLDLVHGHGSPWDAGGVSVVYGRGNGRFDSKGIALVTSEQGVYQVAVGDLNTDGRPDIVAVIDGQVRVYRQDSPSEFTQLSLGQLPGASFGLVVADFDFDRRDDLAWVSQTRTGASTLYIYLQQPDGTFLPAASSGTSIGISAMGLAAGDVDQNGRLDFVTATRLTGTDEHHSLCTFSWSSGTTWKTDLDTDGCTPLLHGGSPLEIQGFDGLFKVDGPHDLALVLRVAQFQVSSTQLRRPGSDGRFTRVEGPTWPIGPPGYRICSYPSRAIIAQLDGEDGADLALRCYDDGSGSGSVHVAFRDDGAFEATAGAVFGAQTDEGDLVAGDLTGDQRQDLVDGVLVYAHRPTDGRAFDVPRIYTLGSDESTRLAAFADFDGNGYLDAAIAGYGNYFASTQTPDGDFSTWVTTTGAAWNRGPAAVGDLDGDYRPDFAHGYTTLSAGSGLALLTQVAGSPFGQYFNGSTLSVGARPRFHDKTMAIADLDSNGLDDLLIMTSGITEDLHVDDVRVRRQTSPGTFALTTDTNSTARFSNDTGRIAVGRLSRVTQETPNPIGIAAAGHCSTLQIPQACVRILNYRASAMTVTETLSLPAGAQVVDLAVGDLNLDGLDDIVVATSNNSGGPVTVVAFRQLASGGFVAVADQWYMGVDGEIRHLAIVDLDRDGRRDLVGLARRSGEMGGVYVVEMLVNRSSGTTIDFEGLERIEGFGGDIDHLQALDARRLGRPALLSIMPWTAGLRIKH